MGGTRSSSSSSSKKKRAAEEDAGGPQQNTLLQDLRPSPASPRYVTRSVRARGGLNPTITTPPPPSPAVSPCLPELPPPMKETNDDDLLPGNKNQTSQKSASRLPPAITLSYHRRNLTRTTTTPPPPAPTPTLKETNDDPLSGKKGEALEKSPSRLFPDVPVTRPAAASSKYSGRGDNTITFPDITTNQNNVTDDVDISISVESTVWAAPISRCNLDLDFLTSKLVVPHSEEPRQVHLVVPPEKSTTNCGGTSFTNITEFAKRVRDKSRDDHIEEVESTFDQTLESVEGHKVKKEVAPLLRSIFRKYGDIARESNVACPSVLSYFLELLCGVYEKLEHSEFSKITCYEQKNMLDEVVYLETQKLNVGWLRERMEQISETQIKVDKYMDLKEETKKHEVSVARIKSKISDLKKKVAEAEDELVAEEAKANEKTELGRDLKDRIKSLKQSMVDGLL